MSEPPFVAISLTTISQRVNDLHRTIDSLLNQDYERYSVSLMLSREPFLIDEGIREIPQSLQQLRVRFGDRFNIRFVPNIGPYRKLLPLLNRLEVRESLVATADDDTEYPANWLSELVAKYLVHKCVICYRGHFTLRESNEFARYRKWMTHPIEQNPSMYILPTGKDGVLYNSSFFHPRIHDIQKALELAPTADDLWIRWHTAAMGVPVYCIRPDYRDSFVDTRETAVGLYEVYNRSGKNDETVSRLQEYAVRELGFDYEARDMFDNYCSVMSR